MRASVAIMQCMVQMVEHLVSRDNLLVSANKLNVDFVEKRARWEEDLFRRWIVYVPLNLHTKFSMDALSRPLIFINTQNGIIQTCYKKANANFLCQARQLADKEYEVPTSRIKPIQKIEKLHS
jgi:hypothetical protein